MNLTPIEIKQQQFEKSLRGYDVAEVQSFLNLVSNQVEHLMNKNQDLAEEIEKLSHRLRHYERIEEALHETIKTTKETVDNKIGQAENEAKIKIEKALLEANGIIREALQQRQHIKQNVMHLLNKREEIIAGINSYLESAKTALNQFSKDEFSTYKLEESDLDNVDSSSIFKDKFQLDTDTETPVSNKEKNKTDENKTDDFDDIDNLLEGID